MVLCIVYASIEKDICMREYLRDIKVDNVFCSGSLRRFLESVKRLFFLALHVGLEKTSAVLVMLSLPLYRKLLLITSFKELRLSDCKLNNISPSLEYVNFTSLVTLDLSDNNFNSELPYWLFNLSSGISHLELQDSNLHGEIPSSSLSLRNLKNLDLSLNDLTGSIPNWFGQLEHLQHLDLSNNLFSGSLPSTLGNLSSLVSLRIGSNSFSGAISETSFSKLSNLEYLDSSNSTTSFWMENQTRNEKNKRFHSFRWYSVPLHHRGYALGLTSADGSSDMDCGLEIIDDVARCFNCGSYNHSLRVSKAS
ncbi:leucine-rich repeat receptor protein kinase MSP1-like [Gastrolobium bilobum]|uniref:leucine-rich repeat receptor protein kinase MSP1-like n=1 Tax=Gastrolobium bilobum TaxID=150636 RepID=UPI002AB03CA3|nr:leucine-rich repeat receptor protein kinase MSP1-like [Gastrolobium bilobum]